MKIWCDKCGKHIERLDTYQHMSGDFVYRMYCHGESESFHFSKELYISADAIELPKNFTAFRKQIV